MSDNPIPRRDFLGTCLAAGATLPVVGVEADGGPARSFRFRLKETAGLRRFGYPVHTLLPAVPGGGPYRLERDGKPVTAQFREVTRPDGRRAVALDFNASPGPLEAENYAVRTGPGVEPGPEPGKGMSVEHVGNEFVVANGSVLAFRVSDRFTMLNSRYAVTQPPAGKSPKLQGLFGLLRRVTNARVDFVPVPPRFAQNLIDNVNGGGTVGIEAAVASKVITREGPLAIGLRFGEGVELTFPNSKSWVEISWNVDDTEGAVSKLEFHQSLQIEGEPLLLDLGASNTVYGHLRGGESMALVAGDAPGLPPLRTAWEVNTIVKETVSPFASATSRQAPPAEGWAHVMDKTRCTAVALSDFGRSTRDEIRVSSEGGLSITRAFAGGGVAPPKSVKAMRFWLHFVTNPVQVGAATSPQAMLAPLAVEWEAPKD